MREACALLKPSWKAATEPKPSTFVPWAIGLYVAAFGLASGRYESRLDQIENRSTGIYAQLGSDKRKALARIPSVQNMPLPEKPELLNPLSVFNSLVRDPKPGATDVREDLQDLLVSFKTELGGINLNRVDLRGAYLRGAYLIRAHLNGARLIGADLIGADLRGADLIRAINLTPEEIATACVDKTTILPDYIKKEDLPDLPTEACKSWEPQ